MVMIIGLMGRIGSGKGTVADIIIRDYGFKSITMGDLAREETINQGLKPTRENTTKVSTELLSSDPAYFINKAINKLRASNHDDWLIDGIRQPIDVAKFKEAFPNIKFIRVDVDPRIRFERMKRRARPGFPETFEEFQKHEGLENQRFNLSETLSNADYVISNNGSFDELEKQVHSLMAKLSS